MGREADGVGMVMKVATFVPVPIEWIADRITQSFDAYLRRELEAAFTQSLFGESWGRPPQELERLELGQVLNWDTTDWEEDE